ncbi:hypothetical protein DM02DRAFT_663302 [Periconia macrospinosa]|uniref:Uncharacterized protein n=1 Tax=Periconia macrospinosa TaxID=97972 RepID=A0A2V1D372_9PLEO|nr:hypothetical protein DM02DRAFT_663302 [Periconia macrospinosa]
MSLPTYDELWEKYERAQALADERMEEILALKRENNHLKARMESSQPPHGGFNGNQVAAGTSVMAAGHSTIVNNYNTYVMPASADTVPTYSTQPQPPATSFPTATLAIRTRDGTPSPPEFNRPCLFRRCNRRACKNVHSDQRDMYKDLIPTLPRH